MVNALFVAGGAKDLQQKLSQLLTLEDWGLALRGPAQRARNLIAKLDRDHDGILQPREWRDRMATSIVEKIDPMKGALNLELIESFFRGQRNYLSLESPQLILEPAIGTAALAAAAKSGLRSAPTLVYLANGISDGTHTIPYSIVAALDPSQAAPLGPFLPPGVEKLADDQIILVDWKESPLRAKAGEKIQLTYFSPEFYGDPKEVTESFRFAGFVPLSGIADAPDITPEFPGITDKLSIDQWDPPFPFDNKRVKQTDDRYWKDYRTTPKAYVTLATGQRLWASRFGNLTSVRLAPAIGTDLQSAAARFRQELLKQLDPVQGGFVFDNVKQDALEAS
ncbi:MAG: hypothetical protein ACRD36_11575, partial [Candidatus Acidiferrum sp.]